VEQWFRCKNLPHQQRERMITCPQCDTGYPDSQTTCPTHGVLLNEIRDLKPGMVIHQSYRIVRKLGQGGMGAVYLAQHTLMNEPQALKFLSSELSHDEAFTARFLREVRTLRQIRHKNVVDAGNLEPAEDGTLFFSMEFVDGPDLRAFLQDAPNYLKLVCHPERAQRVEGPAVVFRVA
jgi:serine/threonine-protein kinase